MTTWLPMTLQGTNPSSFAPIKAPLVRSVSRALRVPEAVAEDAASVAWIQLVRWQPRRDKIAAWLRVVAVREAIRLWDLEVRDVPYEPGEAERQAEVADQGAPARARRGPRRSWQQLAGLPPLQRQVVVRLAAGLQLRGDLVGHGTDPQVGGPPAASALAKACEPRGGPGAPSRPSPPPERLLPMHEICPFAASLALLAASSPRADKPQHERYPHQRRGRHARG